MLEARPGRRHLLVNARDPEELRIALASPGDLEEVVSEQAGQGSRIGTIALGQISQAEVGLDAAFVDFGAGRAGFLHAGHIHPSYLDEAMPLTEAVSAPSPESVQVEGEEEAPTELEAAVGQLPPEGRRLVVQVTRDPARGKGAVLTTFLSLPGRLLVLMPALGRVGISRKVVDEEERERLRSAVESLPAPEGMGIVVRTAARGATSEALDLELQQLLGSWEELLRSIEQAEELGVLREADGTLERTVRELATGEIASIVVDCRSAQERVEQVVGQMSEASRPEVQYWDGPRALFEAFNLEAGYQGLFRPRVSLGKGASIVISETEALIAIDVNSGRLDCGSLEETALQTNLLAARMAARQIRLRDLSGIVVVDFIDMRTAENRERVEREFREALSHDRAKLRPGRLGQFGLMPLTRKRLGTSPLRRLQQPCPTCSGHGSLAAGHAGALRAIRRIRALLDGEAGATTLWRLRLHPLTLDRLQDGWPEELSGATERLELIPDPQVAVGDPVFERAKRRLA